MKAEDQYHTGVVVEDLDSARAQLSELFGYRWSPVFDARVPVWSPEGEQEVRLQFIYSCDTPRVELIQSVEGTVWVVPSGSRIHHLGYWSDDMDGDGARLGTAGYVVEAAGRLPDGTSQWAYHRSPNGLRIELVDRSLRPMLEQFWSSGDS
jgi:hypothetical protein